MKNIFYVLFFSVFSLYLYSQDTIKNGLYEVVYSQSLEQPLFVRYKVMCPYGSASRSGMSFWKPDYIHTSDDSDYEDNIWDKGHMAPVSAFNCDRETIRQTFNYINCALQHQSLNRGSWSRIEQFENDLAKFYDVTVEIEVIFRNPHNRLTTGATVPTGFKRTIRFDNKVIVLYFPNRDNGGMQWHEFIIKR